MCSLEELMKCRIVRYNNSSYLVDEDGVRWTNLENGVYFFVSKYQYFKLVECAYKTYNDFLNGKPYYIKNTLLDDNTKEWLSEIVRILKKVKLDTLELEVFNDYCDIVFERYDGENDFITLPNFENIIYDFSKLEKDKIYTFKELGIKL